MRQNLSALVEIQTQEYSHKTRLILLECNETDAGGC